MYALFYLVGPLTESAAPQLPGRSCAGGVIMRRGASRPRLVLATRYWGSGAQDFANLVGLVQHMASTGVVDAVLVAVRAERDRTGAVDRQEELIAAAEAAGGSPPYLRVLNVAPWGGVSHPLNMLLQIARSDCSADLLMYMSTETRAPREGVLAMIKEATADTAVAGLALPGHEVPRDGEGGTIPSSTPLGAATCPWNTCAVWQIQHLGLIGFPAVSDDVEPVGMEEPPTAALLQRLQPELHIKLLHVDGGPAAGWQTGWNSPSRRAAHQVKMVSKQERTEQQLRRLGVTGTVDLINITVTPPRASGEPRPPPH
eukprot:TRINITY_DN8785_c0_g1_i2.p1 TRINITY_DN8785_c0_g1~~TRINITY_DN8785_c0_g1_i2.p1  ORF type:complete len:314 (+),score=90.77 TRINITY_DN8785_c0_g1_i2:201-1142(+)